MNHQYEGQLEEPDDDNMNWMDLERWVSMCRCGHENADHKQMFVDGRPTSNFPCHGYGCVCGVFEAIDWDESDADYQAMMDYQRGIRCV